MLRYLALCSVLTACAVEPELDEVEQNLTLECPGIVTEGAQTYRGLTGTYQRLGLPAVGEPLRLTLLAERDESDAVGAYTGFYTSESGIAAPYVGRFAALPDNPALGAVLALDVDADGRYDQTYFVLGTTRSFGRVRSLCLGGGARPFLMTRTLY